jgi:hypothetical protein
MHRLAIPALVLAPALVLSLAACDSGSSSGTVTTQPMTQPAPRDTGPKITPLTKADIAKVEAGFASARTLVERARELRKVAEELERTQSRDAANDKFLEARRLYRQAAQDVEHWIEPELGSFTQDQVDGYLGNFVREHAKWMKESAGMGKIHD